MPPPPPPSPLSSRALEQSQITASEGMSQRSSTPSQVRMLRDMFDERPDWWTEEDSLALGSQVHLESFARGLPIDPHSQVDRHLAPAFDGGEGSQQGRGDNTKENIDNLPREEHMPGEGNWEMWNVAGNTSMHTDRSSLPEDVVDFLAMLSQCDMDDLGGDDLL